MPINQHGIRAFSVYLFRAAAKGDLQQVRNRIGMGDDINWTNKMGETALFPCAYANNYKVAEYLIGKGIDVNKTNKLGVSAFFIAESNESLDVAEAIKKKMFSNYVKNAEIKKINKAGSQDKSCKSR
jgi:ankyrin repeat protein